MSELLNDLHAEATTLCDRAADEIERLERELDLAVRLVNRIVNDGNTKLAARDAYAVSLREGWDDALEVMELRGMHDDAGYQRSKAAFAALAKHDDQRGAVSVDNSGRNIERTGTQATAPTTSMPSPSAKNSSELSR